MAFLTATWSNLFLATYAVPPSLLEPRLPPGLSLDLRGGDAFVSLVAFEFERTRVLGVPWPGYRDFAELNLRFYVRRGEERGVVFVRELVPQRDVAWLARVLYNEPYLAAPLVATRAIDDATINMRYELGYAGRTHTIDVTGSLPASRPDADSLEHFFKEHRWGFGTNRRGHTLRYEVEHPCWDVFPIRSYALDFDFGAVYGPAWSFLSTAKPISTVLAVGSPIRVLGHTPLVRAQPASR